MISRSFAEPGAIRICEAEVRAIGACVPFKSTVRKHRNSLVASRESDLQVTLPVIDCSCFIGRDEVLGKNVNY